MSSTCARCSPTGPDLPPPCSRCIAEPGRRRAYHRPMRAIVFERAGGPEVLELKDVPDPEPADRQVLVNVEAVGINYRDVYEREGRGYGATPPAVIGVEGAGHIADTGEPVAWVGVPGSYAERVAA